MDLKVFSRRFLVFVLLAILGLSFLANAWTIHVFPSWFDEAFAADISNNVARGLGRTLTLIPGYISGEFNTYGPLYFELQAHLIRAFGLHAWLFRIPNFLSGYLAIAILSYVLYLSHVQRNFALLFAFASSLDVSVNRVLVSGRLDLLSLFFVTLALLFVSLKPQSFRLNLLVYSLAGGFSGLAYLTTPRSLFLLPVVVLVGSSKLNGFRFRGLTHWQSLSIMLAGLLSFVLPVGIWIASVGGPSAYISMFADNELVHSHISPSFFRSFYDNISIITMLLLVVSHYKLVLKSPLLTGLFCSYLAFSLFVKELGPYAGMIMPFVLMIIFCILSQSPLHLPVRAAVLLFLIVPGMVLTFLRSLDLVLNHACRDPGMVRQSLLKVVDSYGGKDVRFVAPSKYYFMIAPLTRDLLTTELAKSDHRQILDQADVVIGTSRMIDGYRLTDSFVKKSSLNACRPVRVPLLPDSFLNRSIYGESVFFRVRS
jgi:hypothetical protein